MRSRTAFGGALALLSLAAQPAAAQLPGIDVSVVPKIGFYTPASDLEAASTAAGQIVDDRGGSLAVGLAVDFAGVAAPLGLRVGLDYLTGSDFTYADEEANVEATGEQTLLIVAADVVLRPIPRLVIVQPYLLAGAGLKRYDFEFSEEAGDTDIQEAFSDDQNDFAVHAGVGIDLGIGPLALVVELSDYVSWYQSPDAGEDTQMQHDLFIMAGIRLGLF